MANNFILISLSTLRNHIRRLNPSILKNKRIEVISSVIILVALIYLTGIGIEATSGFTKTIDTPAYQVRLQLVDGSGDKEALGYVSKMLDKYNNDQFEVEIISREKYSLSDVNSSIIVARRPQLASSELLADFLGMDRSEIGYHRLAMNREQITTTLILGSDYRQLFDTVRFSQEP